ncbi:hypothetical protein RB195_021186 [Necator americanus]|uniref:Uncharacterized protein n=1 Tax=Necator americanus TaxID=51031 RepID=A0ABR1E9T0_NECAM
MPRRPEFENMIRKQKKATPTGRPKDQRSPSITFDNLLCSPPYPYSSHFCFISDLENCKIFENSNIRRMERAKPASKQKY